jgi:hypothetical protein
LKFWKRRLCGTRAFENFVSSHRLHQNHVFLFRPLFDQCFRASVNRASGVSWLWCSCRKPLGSPLISSLTHEWHNECGECGTQLHRVYFHHRRLMEICWINSALFSIIFHVWWFPFAGSREARVCFVVGRAFSAKDHNTRWRWTLPVYGAIWRT